MMRNIRGRLFLALSLVFAVCLAFPWLIGGYTAELITMYLTYSLVAVSLNLIWGYTGILSLGQFMFFGIGAYSVAMITRSLGESGFVALMPAFVAAIGIPMVVGSVLSYVFFSMKLNELFFLVTIATAMIAQKVASATAFLGGVNGLVLPYWVVPSRIEIFFYIVVIVVGLSLYLCRRLLVSPAGRVLLAIKDSEKRAQYLGYDTRIYKVGIYALAAGLAGLGGGLYAVLSGFVSPALLGFSASFDAVVWTALGGLGTLFGPLLGTIGVNLAEFALSGGFLVQFWPVIMGFLFIVVIIFFPEGLIGIISSFLARLRAGRSAFGEKTERGK